MEMKKKLMRGVCITVTTLLFAASALAAGPEVIADGLKFPEGPLLVNGKLHWVEYAGNSLMRLDGDTKVTVHQQNGCGHNGLSHAPNKQLALVCYESSEILYLDYDGNVIERIDKDADGKAFNHPNDIAFDAKGGAYLTTSGPFVAEPKAIVGGVFYRAPGAPTFKEMADSIHYGNGVAIINKGKTLLVGEHNNNRILSFDIAKDGSLSNRSLFVRLSDLVPGPSQPSIWLGPDGMKVDKDGNIFVAYYLGNKVLKISPEGKLLKSYDIPAIGTTNVEFSESGDSIYVSGAEDLANAPYLGKVWKVKLD
jgi:gluconolactonase